MSLTSEKSIISMVVLNNVKRNDT